MVAANAIAQRAGIGPGLTLSDARARLPGLTSAETDRAGDRAALTRLAAWTGRYSPITAPWHEEEAILIETTGCDHLFGGESAMLADLSGRLESFGLAHRIGLADTPGAAFALARAAPHSPALLAPHALHDGLAELPVASLRLSAEACQLLRRFGLNRIGQLYGIDRRALARRFASRDLADRLVLRLDQALGLRAEPLKPLREPPDFSARLPCPEPLLHPDGVRAGLAELAGDLTARLADHGLGARGFCLKAFRCDGSVGFSEIALARPVRQSAHILRLFAEKLDTLDPGFGIDLLVLEAQRPGRMETGAPGLPGDLAGASIDEVELAALADRITARLGPGSVLVTAPCESHLPERAEAVAPFEGALPDWPPPREGAAPRPLRLLQRPEPLDVLAEVPDGPPLRFVWRRVARRVLRSEGPERINPEWWRAPGEARTRDYYRVEDGEGRRYWLFRDGLYGDGRRGAPQWFMHGIFS